MNKNRGIFDNLPTRPAQASQEPVSGNGSPFAAFAATRPASSFATADDAAAGKLPERRRINPQLQLPDADEGFGFEAAPPSPPQPSPFQSQAPRSAPPVAYEQAPVNSPFAIAPPEQPARPSASPFALAQAEPQARPAPPAYAPEPVLHNGWLSQPAQAAAAYVQPQHQPARQPEYPSDSQSIRQLELRAIFGMDRDMSADEILQRARSLPGIRHVARVAPHDMAAVDSIKQVLANLGMGGGNVRLYSDATPLDFIRESGVVLAVQAENGFAPGVRETLMIVARELSRIP